MNRLTLMSTVALSLASPFSMVAENVHVATPSTSLVLDATQGQPLKVRYYGNHLSASDLANIGALGEREFNAYPVYGLWHEKEAAMSAVHADGNMTLDMAVSDVASSTQADGSTTTTITMTDKVYPFRVEVNYRISIRM